MEGREHSRYNFDKKVRESFSSQKMNKSSDSDDSNSLDNTIDLQQVEYLHEKEDMYARHEIIKNIYSSLIKLTKPYVLIVLIFITVIVYPLSRIELPFTFGSLLMNYLKIFYEIITACTSFVLGAIVSNWVSSKIDK